MNFERAVMECYRLKVCVPPKTERLKPNPQHNGIRRWGVFGRSLGQESEALMNRISGLTGETISPPTRGGHSKKKALSRH